MKKNKERDYLYATGRIRALEGFLLNRDRRDRMIAARSAEDAFRILADCGYSTPSLKTLEELEQLLSEERCRVFDTVGDMIPDKGLVDVFRTRYDIHNIKVLVKDPGRSAESAALLSPCGRIQEEKLTAILREMDLKRLPPAMAHAVTEARDILARTGNPQLSDISLDTACLKEMLILAEGTAIPFLTGYVRLLIDAANLRTLVRIKRMGKEQVLLQQALTPGGNVPLNKLIASRSDTALENLYAGSLLKQSALAGMTSLRENASVTELDRCCDNALNAYLRPARSLAFGAPLAVAYLAAKESEITALRTIFSGRMADLPPDSIRERIRDHYV